MHDCRCIGCGGGRRSVRDHALRRALRRPPRHATTRARGPGEARVGFCEWEAHSCWCSSARMQARVPPRPLLARAGRPPTALLAHSRPTRAGQGLELPPEGLGASGYYEVGTSHPAGRWPPLHCPKPCKPQRSSSLALRPHKPSPLLICTALAQGLYSTFNTQFKKSVAWQNAYKAAPKAACSPDTPSSLCSAGSAAEVNTYAQASHAQPRGRTRRSCSARPLGW